MAVQPFWELGVSIRPSSGVCTAMLGRQECSLDEALR